MTAKQLLDIYTEIYNSANVSADKLGTAYSRLTPIHWWRLGESSGAQTIADSVGGNDGTWEGVHQSATGAPDSAGLAAEFRGRHDAVNLGTLDISSATATICGWFKADSFNYNDGRIISKATSTSTNDHYWMLSTIADSGAMRLRFRLKTNGATSTLIGTAGSFTTDEWVFAAAVYDGSMMRLYQNGVEVGSMSKSGSIDTNSFVSTFIGDNPPGSSRAKYLLDLERMRVAGIGDHRPFTGPVALGADRTDEPTRSLLADVLSTTVDATLVNSTSSPLTHPGAVTEYQLYTGGPVYVVPQLGATLSSQAIEPDPVDNPLGVFRDSGQDTCLDDDTTIEGILIFDGSSNDIKVKGGNVTFTPVELPALDDGTVYELPVGLIEGELKYESVAGGTISGMFIAWDKMHLEPGAYQTLDVVGRVVTRELHLKGPKQWDWISESHWNWATNVFRIWDEYYNSEIAADYFPEWLREFKGWDYNNRLTVKPDDSTPNYHWHDWQNPIIVPHLDDPGLRWDLVEWIDNPITD